MFLIGYRKCIKRPCLRIHMEIEDSTEEDRIPIVINNCDNFLKFLTGKLKWIQIKILQIHQLSAVYD